MSDPDKKMKIALLSPIAWRTPPRAYGPWEQVVSLLAEGLVERGLNVTLFATADSRTRARLHAVCPRPYGEDKSIDPKVWECLHISELFEHADEFDIIHNHFDFLPLAWTRLVNTPVVSTIHGFSSPNILPVYEKYNDGVYYVSISDADRSPALDYTATVHHGIDLAQFTFRETPQDYLLFFGRIHPDKGASAAIEIARAAGLPLIMAGLIQDEGYFSTQVAPHLDGAQIKYVGCVGPAERDRLLGGARALLHPISFAEPFGLSVAEAMACGTPAIAYPRGSMPEIIRHGETGFLVADVQEAVRAVAHLGDLSRQACRREAEVRFSVARMVDDYIRVYEQILDSQEWRRPWGFYEVLADEPDHKVKRITVYPGQRLSLQRHKQRDEHWQVIQGQGMLRLNERDSVIKAPDHAEIPRGTLHRITNTGSVNIVFIEVQSGDYFGEDDIERIEDDYGRA